MRAGLKCIEFDRIGTGLNVYAMHVVHESLKMAGTGIALSTAMFLISLMAVVGPLFVTGQQAPTISVQITASGAAVLGQNGYFLTCTVDGAENLNPYITYQWTRNNGTQIQTHDAQVLFFSSLRLSDAGQYTCQANVTSSYLNNDITATASQNITLQISAPSLAISSNIPNPIHPVGSTVTLTCIVVLSPAVDVPVTIDTVWTGPAAAGFIAINTAQPVMGSTTKYTSAVMISSFGRNQSGVYTCSVTVSSIFSNSFLSNSSPQSETIKVTAGVYLSLKSVVYANNSVIPITEIGSTSSTGLQCITDRIPCCKSSPNRFGEWYFPDRVTTVPRVGTATTFYRNRGDDGTVNLNRLNTSITSPTGLFCCEVPNIDDIIQRICASITPGIAVQIRDRGATPTLGQSYSFTCEATGPGANSPISIYEWRMDGTVLSEIGPSLSFSSLSLSDAGQYTCQIAVNGIKFNHTKEIRLTLPPPASVSVVSNPPSPVDHMSTIILICIVELSPAVMESELSLLMVESFLTKPDGNTLRLTKPAISGITYTYSTQLISFGRNDSGNYTCTATVGPQPTATYLNGSGEFSSATTIIIGVAVEVSFQLIVDEESMQFNFSLSCNSTGGLVENVVWTRDGFFLHSTGPLVLTDNSTSSYSNVLMVSGRVLGTYTCTVRGPSNKVLSSANFIVQASAPPVNVVGTRSSSSAPVEVSWSPPSGDSANIITGYRIFYGSGQSLLVPSYVTRIMLKFIGSQTESVSIRSESIQRLPSELIRVIVTGEPTSSTSHDLGTCTAVGITILAIGLFILLIASIIIIAMLCWWPQRRKNKSSSKNDVAVSANVAYSQVKLKAENKGEKKREYENIVKLKAENKGENRRDIVKVKAEYKREKKREYENIMKLETENKREKKRDYENVEQADIGVPNLLLARSSCDRGKSAPYSYDFPGNKREATVCDVTIAARATTQQL